MKEFFGMLLICCAHFMSILVGGIGQAFTSTSTLLHIYFSRISYRYDEKYAIEPPKEEKPAKVVTLSRGGDA